MLRRQFIQLLTVAGAGSLATVGAIETGKNLRTVTYRVKGFTCITCAVGLETLLRQEKGVAWAKANYPDATVTIRFDPQSLSEDDLKSFVAGMGFKAEPEHKPEPAS